MMRKYQFDSANQGTVSIEVTGEYRDGFEKDFAIIADAWDEYVEISECDDADEVMQVIVDGGVEFDSMRSCAFNRMVIQACMITGDSTVDDCLDYIASKDDDFIDSILQHIRF